MIGDPCSQHESLLLTIMLLRISEYKGEKREVGKKTSTIGFATRCQVRYSSNCTVNLLKVINHRNFTDKNMNHCILTLSSMETVTFIWLKNPGIRVGSPLTSRTCIIIQDMH